MNTRRYPHSVGLLFLVLFLAGCANDSFRGTFPGLGVNSPVSKADISSQAPGNRLTIWHESYEVAAAEARRTGKLVLADFTGSDWCGWCIKMKDDVFSKPEFEAWARDNVVLLELDYPKSKLQSAQIKKQNEMLKQRYGISSYPTVLLLDADGNVQGKMAYTRGDQPASWIARCETQLSRAGNPANGGSQYVAGSGTKGQMR